MRIAVIDDSPMSIALLCSMLKRLGHSNISTYTSGGALLGALRDDPTDVIVFMELHMAEMNGAAILERLRALPKTAAIPVVLLVRDVPCNCLGDYGRLVIQCHRHGGVVCLAKPFTVRSIGNVFSFIGEWQIPKSSELN